MKKTLSIVLAVMMIFAMMVPSFANIYNPEEPDNGKVTDNTAIIKTSETKTDGSDGRTWTVTYDAVTEIPWNTLSQDIEYTATAHLRYNETLTVDVAASENSEMVLLAADGVTVIPDYSLAYTLADTACEIGPVETLTQTFKVNVAQTEWDEAPVGAYSDTITFTATVA